MRRTIRLHANDYPPDHPIIMHRYALLVLFIVWTSPILAIAQAPADNARSSDVRATTGDVPPSNLRAAAGKVDITPPLGIPLAGYGDRTGPASGVKDPLRAGVLILDDGASRASIVTLDLIGVGEEETRLIREMIEDKTGIPGDHILVNASHTHGGPRLEAGSDYGRHVAAEVAGLAETVASRLKPASVGYATEEITSCVNRRLLNAEGEAEMRPNPAGPADPRVRVARVDAADGETLAILFHLACHANVFRNENTEITADYPGLAQELVEDVYAGAAAMYLSGAGANLRPNLPSADGFRSGDDDDLEWIGVDVGAAVLQASARTGSREARMQRESTYDIAAASRTVELPAKDGEPIPIEIQALRVGRTLFLTIPGEPFIQYNTQVEEALGGEDLRVMVVGYANGAHGYFCTADSYRFGGYEPGVSKFAPEAEAILVDALVALGRGTL